MPPRKLCERCSAPAALKRPRNGSFLCRECFFFLFEEETHQTIVLHKLFERGERVACGASGGKDSTVLMHLMKLLNERYDYGLELVLLSIDEGIAGYRDDSLKTVARNQEVYGLPLHVLSYKELYGWSMDEIVKAIGTKNNCTFCGVFRRQALDRGAHKIGAHKIVTGHNADDTAETILMNILRSDAARLSRCVSAVTAGAEGMVPRAKPLKYAYEKEIVLYAHFKKLDYFTTECTYSKEAFRGNARTLIKELEAIRPRCIQDILYSGEHLPGAQSVAGSSVNSAAATLPPQHLCKRCGYIASQELCRACVLLDSLNQGTHQLALRSTMGSDDPSSSTRVKRDRE